MAKLPNIEDFGGRPTPGVVGPANFGTPDVGSGARSIGQGISEFAAAIDKVQYRDDKLRAEDAFNQLQQKSIDFTSGDDGYERLKAGQVAGKPVYKSYLEKFNQAADEISSKLDNDQQRQFFRGRADVSRLQYGNNLINHIQKEKDVYAKQVLEGGRAIEVQNAGANWNKPGDVALSVERTKRLIADQADHEGWSSDFAKAKELQATSAIHETVIAQAIDSDNPEYAKEYYKQSKSQIEADKYAALENLIKKSDDKILAQTVADDAMNRNLTEAQALAEARKKYKGDQEDAIVASIRDRFREKDQLRKDNYDQAANTAWTIYAQSRDFNKIPLTTLEQMDGKERESLHAYAEREKSGQKTETNWGVYYDLIRMAKDDPAQFKNQNLLKYQPYLNKSELKQMMELQTKPENIDYIESQSQLAKRKIAQAGLDPKNTDKNNDQGRAIASFYSNLNNEIAAYQAKTGKKPDDQKLNEIMDKMLENKVFVDEWFTDPEKPVSTLTPKELEGAYVEVEGKEVKLNDIPEKDRVYLIRRMMDSGIPVTEKGIARAWLIMTGKI